MPAGGLRRGRGAQVTVWFPAQFAELRRLCLAGGGGEAAFAASLSRCHAWAARGGKSKSYFAKARAPRGAIIGYGYRAGLQPSACPARGRVLRARLHVFSAVTPGGGSCSAPSCVPRRSWCAAPNLAPHALCMHVKAVGTPVQAPSTPQTHNARCPARTADGSPCADSAWPRRQSRDNRFIVKQLSAAERRSFKEIAPNYFAYLARAMRRRQPTCLAKIMGVFTARAPSRLPRTRDAPSLLRASDRVHGCLPGPANVACGRGQSAPLEARQGSACMSTRGQVMSLMRPGPEAARAATTSRCAAWAAQVARRTIGAGRASAQGRAVGSATRPEAARAGAQVALRGAGGKETALDVLVMENVFYERALAPVYDLKGSSRARLSADDPADPASVLLDENLKQTSRSAPLLVPACRGVAPPALWSETAA